MGRGWKRPPQDGAWFALGPFSALRQSTPIQRGRRQAASGFSAARAGRAHQPHTLSLNRYGLGLWNAGSIRHGAVATWRRVVRPVAVVRRSRFAWTHGGSRRPGRHGRCRLVVRRLWWATGAGKSTDDPHTPSASHFVRALPTLRVGRSCVARQHDRHSSCTDARSAEALFGRTWIQRAREERNARRTQRTGLFAHGSGSQETESRIGCHEHKRTESSNTVGVADGSCAVVDGSGFDGS